jgi:hypothetical protein
VRVAVRELRTLARGASLSFALAVGRIVVESLYDGDLTAWRRRERKEHALRTLAAQSDLPISASALYRALAVYELCQRPGARAMQWQHLGLSHVRAVLGLPVEVQNRLLKLAEEERWTVARLERETLGIRPSARPNGGRTAVAPYIKSIRRIFQLTSPEALQGLDDWARLDAAELDELAQKLAQARARLERLEQVLPRGAGAHAALPRAARRG